MFLLIPLYLYYMCPCTWMGVTTVSDHTHHLELHIITFSCILYIPPGNADGEAVAVDMDKDAM